MDESSQATQEEQKQSEPPVREIHHHHYHHKGGFDVGRIFWALIIILIGFVLLGNNFGWFNYSLENLWKFWPVILILIGLSILTRRGILSSIIGIIIVLILIAGIVLSIVFGSTKTEVTTKSFSEPLDPAITLAKINVDAGAGNIILKAGETDLFSGTLESDFAGLKIDSSTSSTTKTVNLTLDTNNHWFFFGSHKNNLNLLVTKQIPVEMKFDVGAMDMDMDFSEIKLSKLEIDSGATTSEIKLGSLVDKAEFTLDTGASTTTLSLPKDLGAKLTLSSGASSKNLPDFKKIDDNTYQSENYDQATKKIDMTVKMGAATFNVEWY